MGQLNVSKDSAATAASSKVVVPVNSSHGSFEQDPDTYPVRLAALVIVSGCVHARTPRSQHALLPRARVQGRLLFHINGLRRERRNVHGRRRIMLADRKDSERSQAREDERSQGERIWADIV
jgi:hypothetical protein